MGYFFHATRTSSIAWGSSGAGSQFYRTQNVYKTTPGTRRTETPYQGRLSLYSDASKQNASNGASVPYPSCDSSSNQDPIGRLNNDYYGLIPLATNKARSRFIDAMKENREASIGAALAEFNKSLGMIGGRMSQLLSFTRALKRGDIRGANRALAIPKGYRPKQKSFAGAYLEYSFGWAPLLGDVHDGMEVISSPLPSNGRVRVTGSSVRFQPLTESYRNSLTYPTVFTLSGTFVAVCGLRGDTKLVNPNLELLASLGLVNPLSVAWELVPFSFLVDYVVGVGDFLNSFSDEVGWKISNVGISKFSHLRDGFHKRSENVGGPYQRSCTLGTAYAVKMDRATGFSLPPYSLEFVNPLSGISARRAATTVALLLQFLN